MWICYFQIFSYFRKYFHFHFLFLVKIEIDNNKPNTTLSFFIWCYFLITLLAMILMLTLLLDHRVAMEKDWRRGGIVRIDRGKRRQGWLGRERGIYLWWIICDEVYNIPYNGPPHMSSTYLRQLISSYRDFLLFFLSTFENGLSRKLS